MVGKVTVIGSGAMGTGCSVLLAERPGRQVALWTRRPETAAEIASCRENRRLLPGVHLPEGVEITSDLERALVGAGLVVIAIPSAFLRSSLVLFRKFLPPAVPIISVVKGIENDTFFTPSQIIGDVLGARPVVALCGPSHAEEFARRLPASVVVAGHDDSLLKLVQATFTTDRFRVYTNHDIAGVELAAALKNVIAIAAGICDGLAYGDNAKSALLTRGIVEITRFGVALGAHAETFAGLAGIGDLITTCFSGFGRNRRVGERLGQGATLAEALAGIRGVSEGVTTCQSVYGISQKRGIDMPICGEVYQVLFENKSPAAATNALMLRPLRAEWARDDESQG